MPPVDHIRLTLPRGKTWVSSALDWVAVRKTPSGQARILWAEPGLGIRSSVVREGHDRILALLRAAVSGDRFQELAGPPDTDMTVGGEVQKRGRR